MSLDDFYYTPYENYLVNRSGVVLNIGRNTNVNPVVTQFSDKDGYQRVSINFPKNETRSGVASKQIPVHRIVALTFLDKPDGHVVNHLNGIRDDNRLDNLEWLTPADNERHARTHLGKKIMGEQTSNSKLTAEEVLEIRGFSDKSMRAIGEIYGISSAQVSRIVNRQCWSHI